MSFIFKEQSNENISQTLITFADEETNTTYSSRMNRRHRCFEFITNSKSMTIFSICPCLIGKESMFILIIAYLTTRPNSLSWGENFRLSGGKTATSFAVTNVTIYQLKYV